MRALLVSTLLTLGAYFGSVDQQFETPLDIKIVVNHALILSLYWHAADFDSQTELRLYQWPITPAEKPLRVRI